MALTTFPRTAQVRPICIMNDDLINKWTVTRPVWPAVKQLRVSSATRPQAEASFHLPSWASGAVRGAEGAQPGGGCSSGRLSGCCCREKLSD